MLKVLRFLGLALLATAGLRAAPVAPSPAGNLLPLLNAFIALVAKDHPEYKKDIELYRAGTDVLPGFQLGTSAKMGTYLFRPKTWTDLTPGEQESVLRHPKLKAFIVSIRNARIYPAVSGANAEDAKLPGWFPVEGAKDTPREYHVAIAADEMLRTRSVEIPVEVRPAQ